MILLYLRRNFSFCNNRKDFFLTKQYLQDIFYNQILFHYYKIIISQHFSVFGQFSAANTKKNDICDIFNRIAHTIFKDYKCSISDRHLQSFGLVEKIDIN